jgi:hypothetical protein
MCFVKNLSHLSVCEKKRASFATLVPSFLEFDIDSILALQDRITSALSKLVGMFNRNRSVFGSRPSETSQLSLFE